MSGLARRTENIRSVGPQVQREGVVDSNHNPNGDLGVSRTTVPSGAVGPGNNRTVGSDKLGMSGNNTPLSQDQQSAGGQSVHKGEENYNVIGQQSGSDQTGGGEHQVPTHVKSKNIRESVVAPSSRGSGVQSVRLRICLFWQHSVVK